MTHPDAARQVPRTDRPAAGSPSGQLIDRAAEIGDRLLREAMADTPSTLTWGGGYGIRFQPVEDAGIFNGRIGEALFFAALYQATGDAGHADAALRASATLRGILRDEGGPARLTGEIGVGLTGMGSIIYALVRASEFLQMPELMTDARLAARGITLAAIRADRVNDVFSGTAGALLGLLSLTGAGDESILELGLACGDALLQRRTPDPATGLRAWATLEPEPWTGFAHGSSGIAASMLALDGHVGDSQYSKAALEAFAFERTLMRPERGDWPDSRSATPGMAVQTSWCHGSPGIALSRLRALEHLTDEDEGTLVLDDLDYALTSTCEQPLHLMDNLCCGNFGRADIVLEASLLLENESLEAHARNLADSCLERAERSGFGLPIYSEGPHVRPGLWQGLAGIGYSLLRLDQPARFPCLLYFA
jgi:lantibiotic modifying enzyme